MVSLLSVAIAYALTASVKPFWGGKVPLIFFVLATLLSAAQGGALPGLAATGVGFIVVNQLFEPRVMLLSVAHSSLIIFVVLGVGISLTVGHLKKTNAALSLAKQRLEERTKALAQTNEELQHFAFGLAHDLKTPLHGISIFADLLVQETAGKLDDSSKEYAQIIVSRVHAALAMVKGLLNFAAVAENVVEPTVVDCNSALEQALGDLAYVIKESKAEMLVEALPAVLAADTQIVSIFSNLIGNAIKYRSVDTPPIIRISAAEQEGKSLFCVSDNGIGIDMKYAGQIFQMFRRLHSESQYEGHGIGLALCKTIIQGYGGEIWVESEMGKGSRFFFTLPRVNQAFAAAAVNGAHAASAN